MEVNRDNQNINVTVNEIFGTGVKSFTQTKLSEESHGENEVSVVLTNGATFTFKFYNGEKGEQGERGYGISNVQLNDDYTLTVTLENGLHFNTPSIRGEKGEQGTGIQSVELRNDYSLLFTLENGKTLETTAILGKELENIRKLEASASSASKIATSSSVSARASAQTAEAKANEASTSATTASQKAEEASASAQTAAAKANEAKASADSVVNVVTDVSQLKSDLVDVDTRLSESIAEIDGLQIISTEEVSKGKLSDATEVAKETPFYGYSVPIKNITNIRKVVINGIYVKGNSNSSVDCLLEFLDENKEVKSYKSVALKSGTSTTFNENVEFIFNSPVNIPIGYMRISCSVAISYTDNRNKNMGTIFDGASRVGQFLENYGGIWTNLTKSQTYQFSINAEFFSVVDKRESKINLVTNNAIIKYVKSASELIEALAEAEENAKENQWYNIHIASGEYNLLPFVDLESITEVTSTKYRGIEVPRYTRLIGDNTSRPHIYVDLTEVETTTEQQWTVSTLNMKNDAELYNLVITGMQCRYAVHDDGGKVPYIRYCENCTFIHYQNTGGIVWAQQSSYGNGTYKGCKETFKDCEFIAYHESLYIHDNPNYNVDSEIILDNCRFESTSKPHSVKFQSMGANATTTIKIKDCSFNKPIKKQIDDTSKDSMTITGWKNTIDTDLGVAIE